MCLPFSPQCASALVDLLQFKELHCNHCPSSAGVHFRNADHDMEATTCVSCIGSEGGREQVHSMGPIYMTIKAYTSQGCQSGRQAMGHICCLMMVVCSGCCLTTSPNSAQHPSHAQTTSSLATELDKASEGISQELQ